MPMHICPVCGARHMVSSALHLLAYRRNLTCSPSCKAVFGQLVRRRILTEMAESAERRRLSDRHQVSED